MIRTFVRVVVLAVLGAALFSSPAMADTFQESGDAGEIRSEAADATDATVLNLTRIEGTISPSDHDLYRVRAQKSCTLTMWTESTFDPDLALFAEDGTLLAFNDDRNDGSDDDNESLIRHLVVEPGIYYVGISAFGRLPVSADVWVGTHNWTGSYPIVLDGDCFNADVDGDAVHDGVDNCRGLSNADQANNDGDSEGDACDTDDDNDAVVDGADNCPVTGNTDQANNDGDGQGDACDADDDNDGVADDYPDNCPVNANPTQRDDDGDGAGDVCDSAFNSTVGKATGGGKIVSGDQKVSFSVSAKSELDRTKGTCTVLIGKTKIKCLDVDGYWQSSTSDRVVLVGDASVDGGEPTHFRIELVDRGEPGDDDYFSIETDSGHDASGTVVAGNVQVHRK